MGRSYELGYEAGYAEGQAMVDSIIERTIGGDYVNDRVTKVANYAFIGCSRLVNVLLPVAEQIGVYSFQSCSSLQVVDLPNCTRLEGNSFAYCGSLSKLILRRTDTICALAAVSAFANSAIAKGTGFVYVPDNLVDSYKTTANWSTYASQIKPMSGLEE